MMADDEEKKKKAAAMDAKKAEVRARLEAAAQQKKGKKGFMTPERKKKLRLLLRKKAAEELKKEQERKAAERRRIIEERCGKPKNVDDANEAELQTICREYHARLGKLESEKYDVEWLNRVKDMEINELNIQVNDLRGKFVKPTLKKSLQIREQICKASKESCRIQFPKPA